ncbi:hypothetical protein [Phenylobacterium sp.]|uniref:hypothetical protein n=1 Tax=Phenylobacterium sp. TaxID=1871053 RepID=UPI003BACE6B1
MRHRLILAGLAALGLTSTALAAEGRFIHPADTNKDDRISKTEWVAYKLPPEAFAKADRNGDGLVDGPEFVDWRTAQKTAK